MNGYPPSGRVRARRAAHFSFVIAIVGAVMAVFGYAAAEAHTVLGLGLAASMLGIGFGLVAWAKSLPLDEHAVQDRGPLTVSDEEREAFAAELAGADTLFGRRRALLGLLGTAVAALGIALVGPVGSLGPGPDGERATTAWSRGRRLVTSDGSPVRAFGGGYGLFATVFPEGAVGASDSQVVLLRLRPDLMSSGTQQKAVAGWVAYSKICTHAGCSVGLFGYDDREPVIVRELVCPCHQSVFDPLEQAAPVGGPATIPLPQLPLGIDREGFLVALDDFDGPVGPLAWNEL